MLAQNLRRALVAAVSLTSLLALVGCANSKPQNADIRQPQTADIPKFQTASIHVIDADTGLPLDGVKIRHGGAHLHIQRDGSGLELIGAVEVATTNVNGDARLQPLENGDRISFELDFVDSQSVVVGYYTSGRVQDGSLNLQDFIIGPQKVQAVEHSVVLDPAEVPRVRIHQSFGGPPDPLAQQCLRELHELKPGMRNSNARQLLKAHGFNENLPATARATFPAAKSIDTFERREVYLCDRYPQHALYLILHEESDFGHYRLNEWYIKSLGTGTRTEDADVLRQARPKY